MSGHRPAYGSLATVLGGIVLAVSVFLPWYGVSLTATGLQAAQQAGDQIVSQFGNAALQSDWAGLHARFSGLAGHELAAVSAHDVLSNISVALLILAGIAILLGLLHLAGPDSTLPDPGSGVTAALGLIAACLVLYRILVRPISGNDFVTMPLREGVWLALLGAAAMVAGGVWPRRLQRDAASNADLRKAWSSLSGWTPGR
jgi:hypothetical protein